MLTVKQIFTEGLISKAIGFAVSMSFTLAFLEYFGDPSDPTNALMITIAYTALSIVRGLALRVFFNKFWYRDKV